MDQVLAVTVGDAGKRMYRTRHDRHAAGLERAGRDRSAHVALAVNDAGKRAHLLDVVAGLVLERALRPFADDKVGFNLAGPERLEHAHAKNGAGRPGHADNEPPHSISSAMTCVNARHGRLYASKRTKSILLQGCPVLYFAPAGKDRREGLSPHHRRSASLSCTRPSAA